MRKNLAVLSAFVFYGFPIMAQNIMSINLKGGSSNLYSINQIDSVTFFDFSEPGNGSVIVEGLPEVYADKINSISPFSAVTSALLRSDGGSPVLEKGFCVTSTGYDSLFYAAQGEDLGNFTCNLSNLNSNTRYSARAYARNKFGTSFAGGELIFKTLALYDFYSFMSKQFAIFPESERADDFGYPMVCISSDLNGADMVSTDDGYNWFTASSNYTDRTYTYANPYIRWELFYHQIEAINRSISSIQENTQDKKAQVYKGQALAFRAFCYFSLVQNYQFTYKGNESKPAIPILTTELSNPRATVQEVYNLILSDLNEAIPLLQDFVRADKSQIDQQVAYGIRARVNLVMQNWADAATDAATAVNGYSLLSKSSVSIPSFNSANASSWMWALLIKSSEILDTYSSWPSKLCSFAGNSYTAGVGCYKMINSLLWSKISPTDVRKGWWVDENLNSPLIDNASWPGYEGEAIGPLNIMDMKVPFLAYTNVKFGAYSNEFGNGINASDWCLMRAEEMLLIQVEGLAMSNQLTQAKDILEDFVKNYRDPNYTCLASTKQDLQNEIWFQRRVELWGEGFAFSDIMRLKKNIVRFNDRITSNFPDAYKFNIASDNGWLLLRIPQKEINSNPGIPEEANNKDGFLPITGSGTGLTDGVTD